MTSRESSSPTSTESRSTFTCRLQPQISSDKSDSMEAVRTKLRIRNENLRSVLAEFVGTAILVFIGTSVVAQSVLPKANGNEMIGVNVGFAIAIAFGVAVSAKLSGGHINPAVSLMFLSFGQLKPVKFVLYLLAQVLGAFVGAALTFLIYLDAIAAFDGGERQVTGPKATAGIFASYPAEHLGAFNGVIDQILGTAIFCFLIAHITDKKNSYPTWIQPILVGTAFFAVGSAFGYNCGYPCNPARDFAPRLFTLIAGYGSTTFSHKGWSWIPIVAPLIGGVVGGWLYQLLIGIHTPPDVEEKYVVLTGNQELKPLTGKDAEEAN